MGDINNITKLDLGRVVGLNGISPQVTVQTDTAVSYTLRVRWWDDDRVEHYFDTPNLRSLANSVIGVFNVKTSGGDDVFFVNQPSGGLMKLYDSAGVEVMQFKETSGEVAVTIAGETVAISGRSGGLNKGTYGISKTGDESFVGRKSAVTVSSADADAVKIAASSGGVLVDAKTQALIKVNAAEKIKVTSDAIAMRGPVELRDASGSMMLETTADEIVASAGFRPYPNVVLENTTNDKCGWYSKIATVTLPIRYKGQGISFKVSSHTDIHGRARDLEASFVAYQQQVFGQDPEIEAVATKTTETPVGYNLYYKIVQNTPTTIIEIYTQPRTAYNRGSIYVTSNNGGTIHPTPALIETVPGLIPFDEIILPTTATLADYAKTTDLSVYAKATDLNDYLKVNTKKTVTTGKGLVVKASGSAIGADITAVGASATGIKVTNTGIGIDVVNDGEAGIQVLANAGYGLYVSGTTNWDSIRVTSTNGNGIAVKSSGAAGIDIFVTAGKGISVSGSTSGDSIRVTSTNGNGIYVSSSGAAGIEIFVTAGKGISVTSSKTRFSAQFRTGPICIPTVDVGTVSPIDSDELGNALTSAGYSHSNENIWGGMLIVQANQHSYFLAYLSSYVSPQWNFVKISL